ncbi:TPA: GNAT family N-acetyltransferase [Vibrio parahaemolyticus]|uniref:GNAT family N-acetyltransferase n=1 Tax=Vibrio parahaemolyticus TaxID=670 RepID=UPI00193D8D04|nr:GNAT family N-acetyltransferase [Vibrio parahaemolyticus]MBM4978204.1 GNAT family N-acetyltransferase [Vibrio parahaemolyticus]HCM1322319.1 GNAT family N-acetyltransferase [Vibrio parahaemolyticus]
MYLRPFVSDDATEVSSWFAVYSDSLLWGGRVFSWPIENAEILKRSQQKEIEFFTLTDGDDVVGFIELQHVSDTEMRLCRVAISPKYRGKGLGKTLIRLSLTEIQGRKQYQLVSLAVFTKNVAAYNCYLSLGFAAVDKEPKFKVFGDEKWPLVQMETVL